MKPERDSCLVDLLDRLLNKGMVLNADLIITVAGIPMIGLNLRATLASIETMLDYGMMDAWDKSTRDWYARHKSTVPMVDGEKVLFKSFGYLWHSSGIINNWMPGVWHITDGRLFLWRRDPSEILFEVPLQDIIALRPEMAPNKRTELKIIHNKGVTQIYLSETDMFKDALEKAMMLCQTAVVSHAV